MRQRSQHECCSRLVGPDVACRIRGGSFLLGEGSFWGGKKEKNRKSHSTPRANRFTLKWVRLTRNIFIVGSTRNNGSPCLTEFVNRYMHSVAFQKETGASTIRRDAKGLNRSKRTILEEFSLKKVNLPPSKRALIVLREQKFPKTVLLSPHLLSRFVFKLQKRTYTPKIRTKAGERERHGMGLIWKLKTWGLCGTECECSQPVECSNFKR